MDRCALSTMRRRSMVKVRFINGLVDFLKHPYEEKRRLPLVVCLVSFMTKTV